ncbi:hypothetical protein UPYG_G00054020 [Umbra pygmaea]|uniref:Uncharacterized protein n=1 Tax=Umbra pygmaea TaxID=75934 RepID=A0ABD0X823_UMBPY
MALQPSTLSPFLIGCPTMIYGTQGPLWAGVMVPRRHGEIGSKANNTKTKTEGQSLSKYMIVEDKHQSNWTPAIRSCPYGQIHPCPTNRVPSTQTPPQ